MLGTRPRRLQSARIRGGLALALRNPAISSAAAAGEGRCGPLNALSLHEGELGELEAASATIAVGGGGVATASKAAALQSQRAKRQLDTVATHEAR